MGTRAVIARPLQSPIGTPGWEGRYHHWDGYPTEMVRVLFQIRDAFDGDVEKMLAYIIDEHPGGWSSLKGAGEAIGFVEFKPKTDLLTQEEQERDLDNCYCHGDRAEGWEDGEARTLPVLSHDGTRRGNLMLSHAPKRLDPFPDAPEYKHMEGYVERPPYETWEHAKDDAGNLLYEPSDWGQEWLYIIDADEQMLLVFKWGGVGFFGQSAGGEVRPIASISLRDDCPPREILAEMEQRGYDLGVG